jgi:D-aminopeptidase
MRRPASTGYRTVDCLVLNYTMTGTHQGPLTLPTGDTVPATGRKVTLPCSTTVQLKDGKGVRQNHYWARFNRYGTTPVG